MRFVHKAYLACLYLAFLMLSQFLSQIITIALFFRKNSFSFNSWLLGSHCLQQLITGYPLSSTAAYGGSTHCLQRVSTKIVYKVKESPFPPPPPTSREKEPILDRAGATVSLWHRPLGSFTPVQQGCGVPWTSAEGEGLPSFPKLHF